MIKPHRITPLISTEQVSSGISTMANAIAKKMSPDIMVVSLLRGSFVFTADLIRAMHATGMKPQVDFMTLTSYGNGTESRGEVQIVRDITDSVLGRDVLILDDILESGRTLTFARNLLAGRGAKSIHIAVMLEKPGKRKVAIDADFVGFEIADTFAVGMGLDYANYYRELPFIGAVEFE